MKRFGILGSRYIRIFLIIIPVMTVMAGMSFYLQSLKVTAIAEGITEHEYQYKFAMITDEPDSAFWQEVYKAAVEEAALKGIYIELVGSESMEELPADKAIGLAAYAKSDGIMIYPHDTREITDKINLAGKLGIPVITMYKDSPESTRTGYVGINDYFIGQAYGRRILQLGRNREGIYTVCVLVPSNTLSQDDIRWLEQGISTTIGNEYYHVEVREVHGVNGLTDAGDIIDEMYMDSKLQPDILACFNGEITEIAYRVIDSKKLQERVKIIGSDISDTILQGIAEGNIDSTLTIDAEDLGRKSVDALVQYLEYGLLDYYTEVDTEFVDRDQVLEENGVPNEAVE